MLGMPEAPGLALNLFLKITTSRTSLKKVHTNEKSMYFQAAEREIAVS